MTDIVFRETRADEEPAAGLIDAMVADLVAMYAIPGDRLGTPLDVAQLCPPTGGYVVGFADDRPVSGGGLRTIEPGMGEIKRMYVAPEWRGRGIARRLLGELENLARRRGLTVVRLDTGPKQADAQHLYESAGYLPIGNYNANPHASFWAEKHL